MPYKIYTYEDPYQLHRTDFWEEIRTLPHFCVARTLVNGLRSVMQNQIEGLLCPLDDLVSFPKEGIKSSCKVYGDWTGNISRRIQQHSILTNIFDRELQNGKIDAPFRQALEHNQTHFLDAIRLLIELGISMDSIASVQGNREQKLFVSVLKEVSNLKQFAFPKTPNRQILAHILEELARYERDEARRRNGEDYDAAWYDRMVQNTESQTMEAVVVHGVHQFTPAQLRLLMDMEKMGITIIFLFNYQKNYPAIYRSWTDIYRCFGVPIHHDQNIPAYGTQLMQNPSNALACAMGELCEGRRPVNDPMYRQWHQLYQSIDFLEYANLSEYARYVADQFDAAKEKYKDSRTTWDRNKPIRDRSAVLRYMEEQVYTANRDIHTILKLDYPDYAQDRHFLAYPIGQFFTAMYRLWDYGTGAIRMDIAAIKECLSSKILKSGQSEELLRTFLHLEPLFETVDTYAQFQQRIAGDYLKNYRRIQNSNNQFPADRLQKIEIYNPYKVRLQDVENVIQAIEEINEIALQLFAPEEFQENHIEFAKHFTALETVLKQRNLDMIGEKEQELLEALQVRLNRVKPRNTQFVGTFRDLQNGIYYYMKQKEAEEDVDWIVKNFEQIDGDILQSARQEKFNEKKTYHFACLSDRDFNRKMDELLPWPLTEDFLQTALDPIDLQYQVYYTSIEERSGFLRYALFYGLCFNRCDARLSFVRECDGEMAEPYALLSILGLEPCRDRAEIPNEELSGSYVLPKKKVLSLPYDRQQMMDMFLCPYRFFQDYVMENEPIVQGDFLYQKFYENLLIDAVWRRLEKKPVDHAKQQVSNILRTESGRLQQYFSFWRSTDLHDLELRAWNYIKAKILSDVQNGAIKPVQKSHMDIRYLFGTGAYYLSEDEPIQPHPYPAFAQLVGHKNQQMAYSLHRLPKQTRNDQAAMRNALLYDTMQYMNETGDGEKQFICGPWCTYCNHRNVCMEPFRQTVE